MTKRPRSSKSQESGHQPPYICVECGAPCESLYHQLSPSSIKALTCSNCGEIADPYIEQEWLLVVIDCILMRLEAYRHVLFNADEMKRPSRNQLVISGLIWSGSYQFFTGVKSGCNMQRILSLHPDHFSKHLIYHVANNKQKQLSKERMVRADHLFGQLNSVKKMAELGKQNILKEVN